MADHDDFAMRLALDQAHNAMLAGEVPVGAVIVRPAPDGELGVKVVATGYNRPITTHDPTAHAEIVALRHAAQLMENYRLPDCELFVTLEPCPMCAMALMHARFKRVVFAAPDPKTGAAGSVMNLFAVPRLNHHTEVLGGVMAEAGGTLLREFFIARRAEQKREREELEAITDFDFVALDPIPTRSGMVVEIPVEIGPIPAGDVVEVSPPEADSTPPLPPTAN